MLCARCRNEFDEADLRSPPLWLRVTAVPLLIFKPILIGDATSRYCNRCRRSVNAALFFIVAMLIVAGIAVAIEHLIPEEIRHAHARGQAATPQKNAVPPSNPLSAPRMFGPAALVPRLRVLYRTIKAIDDGTESIPLDDSDPGADSLADTDRMILKVVTNFGKTLSDNDFNIAVEFAISAEGKPLRWVLAGLMVDRGRFDDVAKLVVADLVDDPENRSYRNWKWWEANFGDRENYDRLSRQLTDALLGRFDGGNDEERLVIAELFGKGKEEAGLGLAEFKRAIGYKE